MHTRHVYLYLTVTQLSINIVRFTINGPLTTPDTRDRGRDELRCITPRE